MTRTRGNGQGTVFKMPNGKWRAEATIGWDELENGKKKRIIKTKSGFKLKKDALAALPDLMGQTSDVNPAITFKALYDLWSVPRFAKVSKSTEDGYKSGFKYSKSIHYKTFSKLKTADLQAVIDECPFGRRTKADIKSLFTNMYNYALENDYCNKNYAEFVKLPPKGKSDHDAFTKAERLATAYSDLTKVNAAIDLLMQGKLVQRLEIGSQEFRRVYDYNKVTLNELKELRKELLELIDSLEEVSQVIYRTGASVPLIVSRGF